VAAGRISLINLGQQREVVILDQHDRGPGRRLFDDGVGKLAFTALYWSQSRRRNSGRTCAMWHRGQMPSFAKP